MNLFKTVGLYFLAFLVVAVDIVYFLSLSMSDGRLGQIDKALWNLGVEYFCSLGMQATPDFKVPVIDRELDHALHFAVQLKDVAHNISTLLHFPVRSFGRLICSELPDMIAAAQEARIAQADAKTKTIVAQIEKTVLRSPIAGVVTKAEGSAGEIVQSGALLVSVLSEQLFEIEANVPESDIGLVQRANKAHVSFDAFSGSVFIGAVALIDPAETVIDGVVNFTINVLLDYPDARFKSGLTADIDIETARRDDVLVIPQAALAEEDDGEFVYKATNGGVVSVPIKIGMRGTDGLVEVAEGLSEGDSIIAVSRMYDDGR